MSDFSISHTSADTPVRLQNIFSTEFDSAVLVNDNKMVFIFREGRNTYKKLLFNQAEMSFSAGGDAKTILADFMSNGDKLLIDECFSFNQGASL